MLRLQYFDRQGEPLSEKRWLELYRVAEYRRVRRTKLPGDIDVLTTWLGMDFGPPGFHREIFGTMVFGADEETENGEQERYSTEDQAVAGHERWVAKLRRNGLRLV